MSGEEGVGRIIALVLAALVIVGAGAAYMFRGELAVMALQRAAPRAMALAPLPDGLHVGFCGTGSPLPDRTRAGPCTAVLAGERLFVFDAGEGAAETLSMMGMSADQVDTVFLTHLHSDHFDGLAAVALQHWAGGAATEPLLVIGPPGVERVTGGLNEAYAIDSGYRTAHHGPEIAPPSGFGMAVRAFVMPEGASEVVVLDDGGVRITAFLVAHAPVDNAVGYRVDYAGRSVVISGDTAKSENLIRVSQGADLLVHEAISPRISLIYGEAAASAGRGGVSQIFTDILDYHASPQDAADSAQQAGVEALAITHILPPLVVPGLDQAFLADAPSLFDGPIWLMRDGDIISLPVSGGMQRSHRMN